MNPIIVKIFNLCIATLTMLQSRRGQQLPNFSGVIYQPLLFICPNKFLKGKMSSVLNNEYLST